MKIALDAGHGGARGARGNGLVEDELALDFVIRIGHHIRLKGHQTVYTRSDNRHISLEKRGKIINANKCDLMLSVHLNAASSEKARGIEAFAAYGDDRSLKIAKKLLNKISEACAIPSRGAKWDNQSQHCSLKILRDTFKNMPAILIELGFLTNSEDTKLLKDKFFRENASKIIANTLT